MLSQPSRYSNSVRLRSMKLRTHGQSFTHFSMFGRIHCREGISGLYLRVEDSTRQARQSAGGTLLYLELHQVVATTVLKA